MILFYFIKYCLFYLIKCKDKNGRGGSGFSLPPQPMGVGIPLPTPKKGGLHGMGFPPPPLP